METETKMKKLGHDRVTIFVISLMVVFIILLNVISYFVS